MSLEKKVGIRITGKTDQAAGEIAKVGKEFDKAYEKAGRFGRVGLLMKQSTLDIKKMAGNAAQAFGVLAGGVYTMDKIIMGQAKYNALVKNAPFEIKSATQATQGYISQTKLLESANAANRAGFIKSSKVFADYASDVQKLAMATGEDTSEAMDVLTRALAKNESELLDNYNINLKVRQAQDMYAEQLGTTTSALTEQQKANAFGIIGMQKIKEVAAKANVEIDAHTAAWMKLKASLMDFPKLMHDASEAIVDGMSGLDEWQRKAGRALRGEADLAGDNRRGFGMRGANKLGQGFRDKILASVTRDEKGNVSGGGGASTAVLEEWKGRMDAYGTFVGETGAKAMVDAAEAAAIAMVTGEGKKKGKGKHAKFQWGAELMEQISMANAKSGMDRNAASFSTELGAAQNAKSDQDTTDALIKHYQDAELRKADAVLEARLMGLELAKAKGLDPDSLAAAEEQAIQRQLDAKERYVDATMRGTERVIAIEEIQAARRKAHHQRELANISQELKAREKQKQRMQMVGDAVVNVHAGIAGAAISAAFAEGESVKKNVAGFAKSQGIQMAILASTEGIKAVASAASLNAPGAAAHGEAAALAAAEAGVLFGLAGATGGFSGGGGRGHGGGGGGGFGGGSMGGSHSSPSNAGAPPISHRVNGPGANQPSPPAMQSGGGHTVNLNVYNQSLLPQDTAQQAIALRRMIAESVRDNPRV